MKTEQSTANWFLTTLVSVGCYSTEITLQRKNEKVSAQKSSCHITTVAENKGIKKIKPENRNGKFVLVFLLQNQL